MSRVYRPVCRSFVRRARPFTDKQEADFSHLAVDYLIPFDARTPAPLEVAARFGGRPLLLEIGFGNGDATWQIAQRNPQLCYLAVDIYRPGILKLMRACQQQGLDNLRVVEADVIPLLNYGLPGPILQGVHLFFPDPWPKKRHHQRRLLQSASLDLLADRLTAHGYIYFVTDWPNYARQVATQVQQHPQWQLLPLRQRPWRPATAFELKARVKGHKIFELLLGRRSSSCAT